MGDSETAVAETSAVVGYTSAGYASIAYTEANSNVAPSTDSSGPETTGYFGACVAPADATHASSDLCEGNAYGTGPNSAVQEPQNNMTHENKPDSENVAGFESASMVSSKAAGYNSAINGNIINEAGNATLVENGISADNVNGASAAPEFVDGSVSAMSGEEDRLWSIVRANSLDFNAWTALIEETEKVAEDNILKIRRVYDAFLAEFPLCYGYWKKYADHEARVGAMDKVVEVYERAVQGVTYSVDIWLHYCIFAINTYGDPDTIRRALVKFVAF